VARFDKYDPNVGGFRAPLAATLADAGVGLVKGVGLNSSGQVVIGAGNTGVIGVIVDNGLLTDGVVKGKLAGEIIDVMTSGEIVECASLVAGTGYWADPTTGVLEAEALGDAKVGVTSEATRLIVRMGSGGGGEGALLVPAAAIVHLTDSSGGAAGNDTIAAIGDGIAALTVLTDSSGGTANDTIAAITNAANAGSADVGPVADAIADLAAKVNAIITAGGADKSDTADAIADLARKVNLILTTLETAGILTP